jgi:hypothetical protein
MHEQPNWLLVEGVEDQYAVVMLMKHHVSWPNTKNQKKYPVQIEFAGSVSELLQKEYIPTHIKKSGLRALGVMLDADDKLKSRWKKVRNRCLGEFPNFPQEPQPSGLIIQNASGKRFGLWVMPNNYSEGMLETFLRLLVRKGQKRTWKYAKNTVKRARKMGAKCRECHIDKANIHTWLSWQNPPGQALGNAIAKKILDPKSAGARDFVQWFIKLFELTPL